METNDISLVFENIRPGLTAHEQAEMDGHQVLTLKEVPPAFMSEAEALLEGLAAAGRGYAICRRKDGEVIVLYRNR